MNGSLPMTLQKRGMEQKLIIAQRSPQQDLAPFKSFVKAYQWLSDMMQGQTFASIAIKERQ